MEIKNKQPIIIADASGLVSLLVTSDTNHRRAVLSAEQLSLEGGMLIIPDELFAETVNLLGKKFSHDAAHRAGERLLASALFLVSSTDLDTRTHALRLFRATPASVSFTDCLVMATADKYNTREIFGFDEIFRKKGYHLPTQLKEAS